METSSVFLFGLMVAKTVAVFQGGEFGTIRNGLSAEILGISLTKPNDCHKIDFRV